MPDPIGTTRSIVELVQEVVDRGREREERDRVRLSGFLDDVDDTLAGLLGKGPREEGVDYERGRLGKLAKGAGSAEGFGAGESGRLAELLAEIVNYEPPYSEETKRAIDWLRGEISGMAVNIRHHLSVSSDVSPEPPPEDASPGPHPPPGSDPPAGPDWPPPMLNKAALLVAGAVLFAIVVLWILTRF